MLSNEIIVPNGIVTYSEIISKMDSILRDLTMEVFLDVSFSYIVHIPSSDVKVYNFTDRSAYIVLQVGKFIYVIM